MTEPTREQIEGDKFTDPRSAWEHRHNAMCDELLRLRSPSTPGVDELTALDAACTLLEEAGHKHIYKDGRIYTRAGCAHLAATLRTLATRGRP